MGSRLSSTTVEFSTFHEFLTRTIQITNSLNRGDVTVWRVWWSHPWAFEYRASGEVQWGRCVPPLVTS